MAAVRDKLRQGQGKRVFVRGMKLPGHIPHRLTWGSFVVVVGIMLAAWLGSSREHEGCYAMEDGLVLRVGHQGAAVLRAGEVLDETGIKKVRPTRGFLFDLEEAFSPLSSEGGRTFFEGNRPGSGQANTPTIAVSQQWAQPEKAIINLSDGRRAEYPLIDCQDEKQ